jgi:CHAT domain-containing protein
MAPPFRPRLQAATDENAFPKTRRIDRAEALRWSIAALIAMGGGYAHPSVWVPFVLVGNGEQ